MSPHLSAPHRTIPKGRNSHANQMSCTHAPKIGVVEVQSTPQGAAWGEVKEKRSGHGKPMALRGVDVDDDPKESAVSLRAHITLRLDVTPMI